MDGISDEIYEDHERLMLRASPNETHPALRRLGQCPDAVDREDLVNPRRTVITRMKTTHSMLVERRLYTQTPTPCTIGSVTRVEPDYTA